MPSPTFPLSSYLTGSGGGRTYRLELDIISNNSPLSSHSSSASSTLSESSNTTPLFISTKRSRGPRKRPNQCSAEAAALLSSIYPKLFCVNNHHLLNIPHLQQPPDDPFPLLLPSFPISNDANLLLPSPTNSSSLLSKPTRILQPLSTNTADFHSQDPASPDFDAESILDEEVEEGIDSIMGNLSMNKETNLDCLNSTSNSAINPCLISSPFGFGFGISSSIRGAFRRSNDGDWWRSPKVAVNDILPNLNVNPSDDKKKKKKKKKNKIKVKNSSIFSQPEDGILKAKLGLKLDYQGIIKEWTGGYPFSADTGLLPCSTADLIASLADIDESRDGGMREASVQRYKEKRRNRFFSKKIRYEVRKTNANHRPRMKGRFVRGPLLLEAMPEGSHEKA